MSVSFANSTFAEIIPPPPPKVQFQYENFRFATGRSCESSWIDPSFCEASHPKSWTQQEFDLMKSLIEPLFDGRLPNFLARVESNGYNTFFRYTYLWQRNPDGVTFSNLKHIGMWIWSRDLSINIGDGILGANSPTFQNQLGFDMRKHAVFHEVVHAFDNGALSTSNEFLNLIGWVPEGRGHILRGVDPTEMVTVITRMRELSEKRQYDELLRINREFGLKHGFPTAYAMTIPQECFAELAAYIFYDPNVRDYMKPEWIEWFQRNVLQ